MLSKESLKISRRTALVIVTAVAVLAALAALWYLQSLVFILFAAFLLMLALQPLVKWIIKWTRLPKGMAIFLAYVIFLVAVIVLASLILPALISELLNILRQINIQSIAPSLADEFGNFKLTLTEMSDLFTRFSSSIFTMLGLVTNTFNTLLSAIMLFVISMHLAFDHKNLYKRCYWFTDDERKIVRVQKFVYGLEKELGGWIVGQVLLMVIIGSVTATGLYFIGVPYALPLGILSGMLEIVPNIGPVIAAVPAVAIGFLVGGPVTGVVTLIFTVLVQQLENIFIVPQVMKNTANVNPIVSILVILGGFEIFGAVGALLSIPAYITLRSFYSFWIKNKIYSADGE